PQPRPRSRRRTLLPRPADPCELSSGRLSRDRSRTGDRMIPPRWLHTAWMLTSASEARAFRHATRQVARTQADLLGETLRANRDTAFGRAHDFRRIKGVRDFQRRVPLSTYDDYADSVRRIAAGE